MKSLTSFFADLVGEHVVGDRCEISAPWHQGESSADCLSVESVLDENELMERSICEVVPGVWMAACLCEGQDRALVRVRDMNADPSEVIRLLSDVASCLCRIVSKRMGRRLIPLLSYNQSTFSSFDIYNATLRFVPCPPQPK